MRRKSGVLDFVILLIVAGGAALMLYGWIKYPFAPVRQVNEKFFDKQNKERTAEEFLAFNTWKTALFIYFGGALFAGFVIVAVDKALGKENQ